MSVWKKIIWSDITGGKSEKPLETYESWQAHFISERIYLASLIILLANPMFILADHLLYPKHTASLLIIRAVLELGLIGNLLFLRFSKKLYREKIALFLIILITGLAIAQMTVVLGGFSSVYYQGLNLLFLAGAVIVPAIWQIHLLGQLTIIAYYYGSNSLLSTSGHILQEAGASSFFIFWSSVCTLSAVFLYERIQRSEYVNRKELEQSHKKLLELDKLKSDFFANISHELRTPLTLILGAFRTLKKAVPQDELQDVIQSGTRNSSRLLFLINEVLDLAKFDSGRTDIKKQCFDLAGLVRNVAANFESSQQGRLHVRGANQVVLIEGDLKQLQKVLYNLLSNAFKFSDPETGHVWIRLSRKDDWIGLEVEDDGIGIPPDHIERIFDRFVQVESTAIRRYEGSGIGLAIVREVATAHGGTITAQSDPGHGACFMLRIPQGQVRDVEIVSVSEADDLELVHHVVDNRHSTVPILPADRTSPETSRPRVLVVEDNHELRAYLVNLLRPHYVLAEARDGIEGLQLAKALLPDLILTDAMMPRMSGDELLKTIRGDDQLRRTPVVMLTARAGTEARVESLASGADDYLTKPFEETEVVVRVDNLIKARAQERDFREAQRNRLTQFLPSQVADLALTGEAEQLLKGLRKDVSVVFIDLRGFTAFVESGEPEDVLDVLREYQAIAGRHIETYEGTLDRFIGDGVMVYFNDREPVPDHATRAVRLALTLRDAMVQLHHGWAQKGFELGVGIGIATGYATVGVVGSKNRKEYTVIGTVTNLSARLCQEASHGQVLISERVFEQVEHLIKYESVGSILLKGFHRTVNVYNVLGLQ